MASLALAELSDLTARMGEVDGPRALAAIDDASALIHTETGNIWILDGELVDDVPPIALTVCCSVARRVLENPEGLVSETLGPSTDTWANPSSDVYLTRAEQRLLNKASGTSAGTIQLDARVPW